MCTKTEKFVSKLAKYRLSLIEVNEYDTLSLTMPKVTLLA